MPRIGACAKVGARSRKLKLRWCHCLTPGYIQTVRWLYGVERLALRAVAPRRAARRLRPPGADYDSGRPLCAGGVVAARPLAWSAGLRSGEFLRLTLSRRIGVRRSCAA